MSPKWKIARDQKLSLGPILESLISIIFFWIMNSGLNTLFYNACEFSLVSQLVNKFKLGTEFSSP